jgi:RNA polymerase sigma-70 factor, ECF subfamily
VLRTGEEKRSLNLNLRPPALEGPAMTAETGQNPGTELGAADQAMQRYADGDDDAFPVLYDVVAPRLQAYVRLNVRDPSLVNDIVQQTFLHVHRARSSFLRGAPVLPWIFAIARRLVIDAARLRKAAASVPLDDFDAVTPAPSSEEAVGAHQLARRIEGELARLPSSQRQAFQLVREQGLSLKEAARLLGTTALAVRLRAHRAVRSLRSALERDNRR